MAKLTYEQLQASFNHRMLGGEYDRVAMLRRVLDNLGHPERRFRIIHIAGTNGKGSTGRMLSAILQCAGLRVGHFNSPAMLDQCEQICVNDQPISHQAFVDVYYQIAGALPQGLAPADLTIFEWWTLVMLQYFATLRVDWAVIEVGLGGQNDATNCIDAPELAVITHLALDHTRILGPTIEDIAAAKAGIIKAGTRSVVLAPHQRKEAVQVVKRQAKAQGVPLIDSASHASVIRTGQPTLAGQPLEINSDTIPPTAVTLRLLGDYQLDNLTTVLTVIDCLRRDGVKISDNVVMQALSQTTLPGRLQLVARQPTVILDGAHNPDGARRLTDSLTHLRLTNQPLALVVGFLADKDTATMVQEYRQLPAKVWAATPHNHERAMSAEQLAQSWPGAQACLDGHAALKEAIQAVGPRGVVVVTGSFYLIKEFEALYHH